MGRHGHAPLRHGRPVELGPEGRQRVAERGLEARLPTGRVRLRVELGLLDGGEGLAEPADVGPARLAAGDRRPQAVHEAVPQRRDRDVEVVGAEDRDRGMVEEAVAVGVEAREALALPVEEERARRDQV